MITRRRIVPLLLGTPIILAGNALAEKSGIVDRILERDSELGAPDTSGDSIVDASDLVAYHTLSDSALEFEFEFEVTEGDGDFVVSLLINAGDEALGSYFLRLRYPADSVTLIDVEDGTDPLLGTPNDVTNRPDIGQVELEARQSSSLEAPLGNIEVARLVFQASEATTLSFGFIDGFGADVAGLPRPVASLENESWDWLPVPNSESTTDLSLQPAPR